ncbi:hypothetical protein [Bosea sp. MMO-172]|uniref:hypothetical protein n=1 Tax=Bosea sp. MMO-172 TaxID=3127885 RepID=UPI00301A9A88
MARRKGEITDKRRDVSHPFQVEMVIPMGGLHAGAAIMYRWAAWFDHVTTSHAGRMNWCFLNARTADAFAMDCGGRRVDKPVSPYGIGLDQPSCKELERRAKGSLYAIEIVTGGKSVDTTRLFKEAWKIPFSSFSDPADVARAQGALDKAWAEVASTIPEEQHELERTRMAYLVASYALVAIDEDELAQRAVERFRRG